MKRKSEILAKNATMKASRNAYLKHRKMRQALTIFLCKHNLSFQLLNLVQTRITNSNFTYTWNYVLQGFTETSLCHEKRFEVVMKVLKELEKNEFSSAHSNTIIRRICMDLVKFKSEHLLKLCDFCLECLQSQRASQMR